MLESFTSWQALKRSLRTASFSAIALIIIFSLSIKTASAETAILKDPLTSQSMLGARLEKNVLDHPLTIRETVNLADRNYPNVIKAESQTKAAKQNVTVQKLNEYLPESLLQYQELMASHNKLAQVIYASPVFPAIQGPGFPNVNMQPIFNSGVGVSIDWAPIDFGLHKARIDLAKTVYKQSQNQLAATKLDVEITAINSFLNAVQSAEQVKAAQENVRSFQQFSEVVHAQVNAQLKPGADASLADSQLASAQNLLYRARLSMDIAAADLANAIGFGGRLADVNCQGIAAGSENGNIQENMPLYEQVPILQVSKTSLLAAATQKRVLGKERFPVFHFLGGVNTRGAGLNTSGRNQSANVNGVFPVVPNYQVALIINWNFLDTIRLNALRKVQDERIYQQQQDYNLVLQNLKAEDVRSRARIRAAIAIANNMPAQVKAAQDASHQATARYSAGLGSIAQVAEANQLLAQARMQQAVANVDIWRAMLSVASVHGDLSPFIAEATRVQKEIP